ncbi:hypothetical protein IFM61606_10549 [Aspergillus udagawae]|nr:hypothetical protein IFM61606_10549 [Aspergillus udagawae]
MTVVKRTHLYHHIMAMDNFKTDLILYEPTDMSVRHSNTQVYLNQLAAVTEAQEMITVTANEATGESGAEPKMVTADANNPPNSADLTLSALDETFQTTARGRMSLSAEPPTYADAYDTLALDPVALLLIMPSNMHQDGTRLKPWQVTGAAWMLSQEKSPIGGGILADACGTGKTTTLITMLWYASLAADKDPTHTHRPTLILCLSALIGTWLTEL